MTDRDDRFRIVPRSPSGRDAVDLDRWPAVRAALDDLALECSAIAELGRAAFDAPHSLTYRAAEAVVIHFDDLLGRLPDDRAARLPRDLSRSAVRRTRNIVSHNYRAADKAVVWDAVTTRIPAVIAALLGD